MITRSKLIKKIVACQIELRRINKQVLKCRETQLRSLKLEYTQWEARKGAFVELYNEVSNIPWEVQELDNIIQ